MTQCSLAVNKLIRCFLQVLFIMLLIFNSESGNIILQCFDTVGWVIRMKGIQSAKISHTLDPKCSTEGLWEKRSDLE